MLLHFPLYFHFLIKGSQNTGLLHFKYDAEANLKNLSIYVDVLSYLWKAIG